MNGTHIIANLYGCVGNLDNLKSELFAAKCEQVGFTVVGQAVYQFEPQGTTLAVLLAESHLTIHTWPELGTVAMDLYTCNHTKDNTQATLDLYDIIRAYFQPETTEFQVIERGDLKGNT